MPRLIYPHLYPEETLRVCRCDCSASRQFSGSIDGRLIVLPAIPGKRLQPKLRFRVREFPIPEGHQEGYWIEQYRCHFFRDTHYVRELMPEPYRIFLRICSKSRVASVSVGAAYERWEFAHYGNKSWRRADAMPDDDTVHVITAILHLLRGKGLRRWLNEMTPTGWVCPDLLDVA